MLRLSAHLTSIVASILLASAAGAWAQETVSIGGSNAVLLRPASPRASVILMPGGDGKLGVGANGEISSLRGNQLVRTRHAYLKNNLAVLVIEAGTNLVAAVRHMAAIKRPVTVIATSRGTQRAAYGIAQGAKPDALVLTAGFLTDESGSRENVKNILGSPAALPPTLIIHHRRDACRHTLPDGVEPFIRWAGGKARAAWLDGGTDTGNPCQARAYHGFNGLDGRVVSLAAGFRGK
jgi:hypothetical protein